MRIEKSKTFKDFIKTYKEDELEIIEKYYKNSKIEDIGLEKIKSIDEKVNLIVFSELYCKDAAIALPILNELNNLNKLIEIKYLTRNGNEELLKQLSGDKKVPTILKVSGDLEVLDTYIEFPKRFKKTLTEKNREDFIKNKFRTGLYNKAVQEELIELIVK